MNTWSIIFLIIFIIIFIIIIAYCIILSTLAYKDIKIITDSVINGCSYVPTSEDMEKSNIFPIPDFPDTLADEDKDNIKKYLLREEIRFMLDIDKVHNTMTDTFDNFIDVKYNNVNIVRIGIVNSKNYIVLLFAGTSTIEQLKEESNLKQTIFSNDVKCAQGFSNIFKNIEEEIIQGIELIKNGQDINKILGIGYSMGGALISLFYEKYNTLDILNQFYFITIGAPRSCNFKPQDYVPTEKKIFEDYVNYYDLVPHIVFPLLSLTEEVTDTYSRISPDNIVYYDFNCGNSNHNLYTYLLGFGFLTHS